RRPRPRRRRSRPRRRARRARSADRSRSERLAFLCHPTPSTTPIDAVGLFRPVACRGRACRSNLATEAGQMLRDLPVSSRSGRLGRCGPGLRLSLALVLGSVAALYPVLDASPAWAQDDDGDDEDDEDEDDEDSGEEYEEEELEEDPDQP